MQERREQLQMMLEWRDSLIQQTESEIDAIDSIFSSQTRWGFSEHGRLCIRKLIKKFGFNEVYEAAEIAIDRYYDGTEKSWDNAFNKVGGICYNRRKDREENAE